MARVEFRVLGPVEVLVDGRTLTMDSPKQRSLLTFLSIHVGEVQSADRIIDALWGEEPPEGGAKTLRYHVSKLRTTLGDASGVVVTRSPGYLLDVPREAIDSHRFEDLLTQGQSLLPTDPARASHLFDEALALWGGAAFSDFQYEEFVQGEARRLDELRLLAMEDLGRAELASGQHRALVGEFGALVAEYPLRERMRAVLVVALYRAGRQADALREYDRLRKQLVEQLGLDPSPEIEAIVERILDQDPALMSGDPFAATDAAVAAVDVRNPFKGLRPFTEADAADFRGRSDLVMRMAERFAEPGPPGRFLVVVGPSGSGKSSLVRGGLIPALRQGAVAGSERWHIATMYPGSEPVAHLTEILSEVDQGEPQLVIIDQFEEVFVLTEADTQTAFLGMIEELVMGARPIRFVCTLRADFLDRPLSYPSFGRLIDAGLLLVTPLRDDDVRAAVVEPPGSVGVRAEPELVAAMITDVASRAATLPLLQYALTELFEHRRGDTLTLDAYRAAGGISGALARRADHTYLESGAAEREATRQVFLRLVTVTSDAEHLRRRVAVEELTELPIDETSLNHVLDHFGGQRLLTFDRHPESGRPTVEVAHEALLREWPRLWSWVGANREDMRTHRRLSAAVTEWVEAERDPEFLPTGSRLSQLRDWADATSLALNATEQEYLEVATGRAIAQRRRVTRRRRLITATLGAAAAIATILAVVAIAQRNRAQDQTALVERQVRMATARDLAAAARDVIPEDPELSMLLSLEAIETTRDAGEPAVGDAIGSLHQAVLASRWKDTMPGAGDVAWSPDGSRLVTGDPDARHEAAVILDVETGDTLHRLTGMVDVGTVAWSPDGRQIATGDEAGPTILWDAATGERLLPLAETMRYQWGLTFSPDSTLLAGRNIRDSSVTAVDTATGAVVMHVDSGFEEGWGIAFRPGSDEIATVAWNDADTIQLRSVANPQTVMRVIEPAPAVRWISFSRSGDRLAGISAFRTLHVWDADTGEELWNIPVAGDGELAWSPDGSTIAVRSGDRAVVWNAATGEREPLVYQHPTGVTAVSYSPDGRTLATADATRVRLWGASHLRGEVASFPGAWGAVDWLPDGVRVAAYVPAEGVVQLVDVRTNDWLGPWASGLPVVERVVASPDGRFIAVADNSLQRVVVIDLVTQQVEQLPGWAPLGFDSDSSRLIVGNELGESGLYIYETVTWEEVRRIDASALAASFLPDGRHLLVSSQPAQGTRGEGVLWDLADGAEVIRLPLPGRGEPGGVSVSSDGGLVSVGEGETGFVAVWRTDALLNGAHPDEALVRELVGPPGLMDAKLSRDGTQLFTAAETTFAVFDVATGVEAYDIDMGAAIAGFSLAGDGRHVALATENGLHIITTDLDELIEIARDRIGRDLTVDECRSYLNVQACPGE